MLMYLLNRTKSVAWTTGAWDLCTPHHTFSYCSTFI